MGDKQSVHIICPEADVDLEVLMGDGAATITEGIGGWVVSDRPDATGVTQWKGGPPIAQDVPIMLNGFIKGNSVQGQMNAIARLGRNTSGDEVPPLFRLLGPVHYPQLDWVLEAVEYGDAERDEDRTLLRQEAVLKVREYRDGDQIKTRKRRKKKKRGNGGTSAPGSTYTVKKGDTLAKIAAALYGDRSVWKVIAEKNNVRKSVGGPLRDPNRVLETGMELNLPKNPYGDGKG